MMCHLQVVVAYTVIRVQLRILELLRAPLTQFFLRGEHRSYIIPAQCARADIVCPKFWIGFRGCGLGLLTCKFLRHVLSLGARPCRRSCRYPSCCRSFEARGEMLHHAAAARRGAPAATAAPLAARLW